MGRTVNQRFSPWRAIVEFLGARVRPETDPMEAAIDPVGKGPGLMGNKAITHHPDVLAVLEGRPVLDFFANYFGEPVITFDYKWLRWVGPNPKAHYGLFTAPALQAL